MFVTYTLTPRPSPVPCQWSVANSCVNVHVKSVPIVEHSGWLSRQSVFAWFRRSRVRVEWERDDKCVVWFYFGPVFDLLMSTNWSWTTKMNWFAVCTRSWFSWAVKWLVYDSTCRGATWEKVLLHRCTCVWQLYYSCVAILCIMLVNVDQKPKNRTKTDRGKLGVRVVEAESVRGILPKC